MHGSLPKGHEWTATVRPGSEPYVGWELEYEIMTENIGIWIVEVDGVPVRMRQDPPDPKPLVGACVVQDVLYVPASALTASESRVTELRKELEALSHGYADLSDGCVELENQLAVERAKR